MRRTECARARGDAPAPKPDRLRGRQHRTLGQAGSDHKGAGVQYWAVATGLFCDRRRR